MFTGIVVDIAEIYSLKKNHKEDLLISLKITNKPNFDRKLEIGCSIACLGVCLTLIKKELLDNCHILDFQASKETVNKTNISNWFEGKKINIEFALRVGDELGGHLVSGHVDDVVKILDITKVEQSHIFAFELKDNIKKFICQKGSVTLDGVSLTVNDVFPDRFFVNIIDHTFNNTNFHSLRSGDIVNLEIDQIARYVNNFKQFQ